MSNPNLPKKHTFSFAVWQAHMHTQPLSREPIPTAWDHLGRRGLLGRILIDEVDLPPGRTLQELIAELDINYTLDALLPVVNGRVAETSQALKAGDRVNLMPAIRWASLKSPDRI